MKDFENLRVLSVVWFQVENLAAGLECHLRRSLLELLRRRLVLFQVQLRKVLNPPDLAPHFRLHAETKSQFQAFQVRIIERMSGATE